MGFRGAALRPVPMTKRFVPRAQVLYLEKHQRLHRTLLGGDRVTSKVIRRIPRSSPVGS